MHVIVTAIGSEGDINPMLSISRELVLRGHDVDFVANAFFASKVKKYGLRHVALGEADLYEKAVNNDEIWDPQKGFQAIWSELRDGIRPNYELVSERIREDTVLVGTSLAFGSRLAQEAAAVKMATVHLAPSVILSGSDPPRLPFMSLPDWLPEGFRRAFFNLIDSTVLDGICKNDINDIRTSIGLAPVARIMGRWIHSPDLVIGTFPDWFAAVQDDWPQNSVTTGFPLHSLSSGNEALGPQVEDFLAAGSPPIVFTAGSANAFSRDFFRSAASSLGEDRSRRAIFVSQYPDQLPAGLMPGNGNQSIEEGNRFMHVEYAPFSLLFPRSALVVHHGGIGTSAKALASGVPQVVTPFAHDQFDNGHRLSRLGVARSVERLSGSSIAEAIRWLMSTDSVNKACNRFKELMKAEPTAETLSADAIESLK